MAAKKKADSAPGVVETMPGLPGPGTPIDDAAGDEPVITAPYVGAPIEDGANGADLQVSFKALPDEARAALLDIGTTLHEKHIAETGPQRYRVWPHGELLRDDTVYRPGDIIELPAHIGNAIVCLERVS